MRKILISEQEDDMLVLSTPELDGYMYLDIEDGKANTVNLDDNTCQKTFCCSANELRSYLMEKGY